MGISGVSEAGSGPFHLNSTTHALNTTSCTMSASVETLREMQLIPLLVRTARCGLRALQVATAISF